MLSVFAAAITGLVYLVIYPITASLIIKLPINFVLPAIEPLLGVASLQPMPLLYMQVTRSAGAALGLLFLSSSRKSSFPYHVD